MCHSSVAILRTITDRTKIYLISYDGASAMAGTHTGNQAI